MTNEESIKRLKEFIILHQEQAGWDVSTIKALEKAIKALEQKSKYRKEAKRWKNKALGQKRVLDNISEEIDDLRNYSYLVPDMIFDEVQRIIDKYKE